MQSEILFRKSTNETDEENEELEAAKQYFKVVHSRLDISSGNIVIPRYSCLPFYKELEGDIHALQGSMINGYSEHCYVANLDNWYQDLKDYTPKTWFQLATVDSGGPFVLKGLTNSRKNLWNTHMFAADKKAMTEVYSRLMDDTMISEQNICVRQYVPLVKLADGINGLPITQEFRCFFYKTQLLAQGFYWANYAGDLDKLPEAPPHEFLSKIADTVSQHINFFVMDVAKTATGEWIVVELNDGQMSGLSMCSPFELYKNLHEAVSKE